MLEPMRTPELKFFAGARRPDANPTAADANIGYGTTRPAVIGRFKGAGLAYVPFLAIGLAPFVLQSLCGDALHRGAGLAVLL